MSITLLEILVPCLPALLKLDNKTSEEAIERVGKHKWLQAQAIWTRLYPEVEAREEARKAITDVVTNPECPDSIVTLLEELLKIFDSNASLSAEVLQILKEAQSVSEDARFTDQTEELIQNLRKGDECNNGRGVIDENGNCVPKK